MVYKIDPVMTLFMAVRKSPPPKGGSNLDAIAATALPRVNEILMLGLPNPSDFLPHLKLPLFIKFKCKNEKNCLFDKTF